MSRCFSGRDGLRAARTETTRSVFPGDEEEKLHRKAGAHEQSKSTREQKWWTIDLLDARANSRLKHFLQSPWKNLLSARLLPGGRMPGDFYSYLESNQTEARWIPKQKHAESLTFCVRLKYLSELGVFSNCMFFTYNQNIYLKITLVDQPYQSSFRDLNFQIKDKISYKYIITYFIEQRLFQDNYCFLLLHWGFPCISCSRHQKNFRGTLTNSV